MNATVIRLAFQAVLGRRRFLLLLVIPLVLVGLAVAVRALAGEGAGYDEMVAGLGVTLVLPIVALLAASACLGPEIDDGSIVYLLAKPVSRYVVAMSKYLVAVSVTLIFGSAPVFLVGWIADSSQPRMAVAWFLGSAVVAAAYCGLFLVFSVLTRHAVVLGLLFVFLWEGLLGSLLPGVRWVSIADWAAGIAAATAEEIRPGADPVSLRYALIASGRGCGRSRCGVRPSGLARTTLGLGRNRLLGVPNLQHSTQVHPKRTVGTAGPESSHHEFPP
jgi:ABC-2 type transport system permease protein